MKKSAFVRSWLPWIVGICFASILVLWPLMRPGFWVSDDGDWMVIRLSAFAQSFREGQFPVRFLGRLNHSYGYPVANFLYPGFLYIGTLIHVLGVPYVATVKLIMGGSILGASLLSFLWLSRRFSRLASFMGSLSFLFAPYVAYDLFKRGSVGEVFALFAALVALYAVSVESIIFTALGVALLVIAHNTVALLFLPIIIAYLFIERRAKLLVPVALGMGISAFFWVPALMERSYVLFDTVAVSNPAEYFLTMNNWWLVGLVPLACLLVLFLRKPAVAKTPLGLFIAVFVIATAMALPLTAPVWEIEMLAKVVQFPYRFLSVSVVAGAWIVAASVDAWSKQKWVILIGGVVLLILPLVSILQGIVPTYHEEGYYTTNEATTTVADEYMPRWITRKPQSRAAEKLEFYEGKGTISYSKVTSQRIHAEVTAAEDSIIQINTIYYPGWGMLVDGRPMKVIYDNPAGLMRVPLAAGNHRLVIEFRETVGRFIVDLISFASTAMLILYWSIARGRRTA